MRLRKQMEEGLLYKEFGHHDPEDQTYEKILEQQRVHCKEMMYDYNHARPSDVTTKRKILNELLAEAGEEIWMESPVNMSYGCNVHIGHHFYSNFNLVIVDDMDVYIGNYVMFGPNVTLSVTGHPIPGDSRREGTQFSIPIHIGDDVWIGSNTVVLPGVTIGNDVVIGAGSVVTKDIPDHVVAFGNPCRVVREITQRDREYYWKDKKVNDWK